MKTKVSEKKPQRGCLCQCMEPILCSCYSCMVWLLTKIFLTVAVCFMVYYGFLTILQRREPREAFTMAFKDFVNVFYPGDTKR